MAKGNEWIDLVDETIQEALDDADAYIKEYIEPIADIGNPEKILGKKYKDWTREDKILAARIYGSKSPILERFFFNEEYKALRELEE